MNRYTLASAPATLGPDGKPAGASTRGLLRPRTMRDGRHYYVLKEGAEYGDDPEHAFDLRAGEMFAAEPLPKQHDASEASCNPVLVRSEPDAEWERIIRPALAIVGPRAVAERFGTVERTVEAWVAGHNRPQEPMRVARAVAGAARDLGLAVVGDDLAVCRWLPAQLVRARRFNAMAATIIAARFGGRPTLAERLGISLRTLELALIEKSAAAKPVTAFLARLGRLSRAELRASYIASAEVTGMKPKLPCFDDGPCGDRVACVALLSLILGAQSPMLKRAEWCPGLPSLIADRVSPGAAAEARLAALDAKPSGWLALMGEAGRVLGLVPAPR